MTRRIFVTVSRGMTDKTAVCIYPWEQALLESIHGGEIAEVSVEDMCSLKDAVSVVKNAVKIKRIDGVVSDPVPDLRQQYEAMLNVPEDEDPLLDPETEYNRLVDKYGLDKDMPLAVVTRVFGEFRSGGFESAMRTGQPQKAKSTEAMSANELKAELQRQGIDFDKTANKAALRDLLETATA